MGINFSNYGVIDWAISQSHQQPQRINTMNDLIKNTIASTNPSSAITRQLLKKNALPVVAFGGEDGNDEDVSGCYIRGIREWGNGEFLSIFNETFTNALPVSMKGDHIAPLPTEAMDIEDIDGIACRENRLSAICWASDSGDDDDAFLEIIEYKDDKSGEWVSRTCQNYAHVKPVTLKEFQQLYA